MFKVVCYVFVFVCVKCCFVFYNTKRGGDFGSEVKIVKLNIKWV